MGSGQKAAADAEDHADWVVRIEKSKQIVQHMAGLKQDTVLITLHEIHRRISALSHDVPMNKNQRYDMLRLVKSLNELVPPEHQFSLDLL